VEKVDLDPLEYNMSVFDKLWVEKYRPKTIGELLIDDDIRAKVNEYINDKEIPNLLFCSPPGQGKTTLARILVSSIDCQHMYINASDENGIDTIRSKVSGFAQTMSIDGCLKVVVLDEADFLTAQGQAALRNTMETFSDTCRFILTANIKHKIVPAIQSRCTSIDVVPPLKASVQRIFHILNEENVEYKEEDKRAVVSLIKQAYPDLRKVINRLQKSVTNGVLHITESGIGREFCDNILNYTDPLKARKYVIENEAEFNGDYQQLLRSLLDTIYESQEMGDDIKRTFCLLIAEHLYRSTFVVDQEINFFACLLQIY
jgi:DNA polymerase III delta prime subunit